MSIAKTMMMRKRMTRNTMKTKRKMTTAMLVDTITSRETVDTKPALTKNRIILTKVTLVIRRQSIVTFTIEAIAVAMCRTIKP
jgi:hypothetical protein